MPRVNIIIQQGSEQLTAPTQKAGLRLRMNIEK